MREMSSEDLQKRIAELRRELSAERAVARRGGKVPNPKRIRTLRRLIAKGLTILREREMKAGKK